MSPTSDVSLLQPSGNWSLETWEVSGNYARKNR